MIHNSRQWLLDHTEHELLDQVFGKLNFSIRIWRILRGSFPSTWNITLIKQEALLLDLHLIILFTPCWAKPGFEIWFQQQFLLKVVQLPEYV